jgi:hypothetical protein
MVHVSVVFFLSLLKSELFETNDFPYVTKSAEVSSFSFHCHGVDILTPLPIHCLLVLTHARQMYVLIFTANIPTLRPLIRPILHKRSYGAGSYQLTSSLKYSSLEHGNGGSRAVNSSIDRILPKEPDDAYLDIVRKTDLTVSYHTSP